MKSIFDGKFQFIYLFYSPPRGEYGSAGGSYYQPPPRSSRSPRRSNSPGLGTFLNLQPKPSERVNSDLEKYWRDQMSNIAKGPPPTTSRAMPGILKYLSVISRKISVNFFS